MANFAVKVGKCDADACGFRCLEVCPRGVFLAVPGEKHRERQSVYPRHRVVPRFSYFCDGCGDCLPVCPHQLIVVKQK
jgi:NAD-dependent dihydropyrimidine dehydrogenase PreA subunit